MVRYSWVWRCATLQVQTPRCYLWAVGALLSSSCAGLPAKGDIISSWCRVVILVAYLPLYHRGPPYSNRDLFPRGKCLFSSCGRELRYAQLLCPAPRNFVPRCTTGGSCVPHWVARLLRILLFLLAQIIGPRRFTNTLREVRLVIASLPRLCPVSPAHVGASPGPHELAPLRGRTQSGVEYREQ